MATLGMDVSRYQVLLDESYNVIKPIDFCKAKAQGIKFVAVRATVGDYYTDYALNSSYDGSKAQGILTTAYHVVRPEKPIKEQVDRLFTAMAGRKPDLPFVLDCEIKANQLPDRITTVIRGCALDITERDGRRPIIYTRQSWYDCNTNPDPEIAKSDLFAARYMAGLTSPWSDGLYKFRDWTEWGWWQFSADGNGLGTQYGVQSMSIDLDWFNGTEEELYMYAGIMTLPKAVRVTAKNGANIRELPGGGRLITVAPYDLHLYPLEEVLGADGSKFYRVGCNQFIGKGLVEAI